MNETGEVQTVHIGSGHLPPVRQPLAVVAEGNANPFERMAMSLVDRGGDLAKLDQLLELQRKWEADQARKAYTSDMALFKAEPIQIIKSKAVGYETTAGDFVGYKHATVADVVDAVVPAMGRHGFSHHWDVKQDGADITVTCTITHRDGHRESVSMTAKADNSGKKNLIQQVASTVTYLQRYTLMSVTGVAARDQQEDDGRGYGDQEPEEKYVSEEQLRTLQDLVDVYVRNVPKFLEWISARAGFTLESLAETPAKLFNEVHGQLNRLRQDQVEGAK